MCVPKDDMNECTDDVCENGAPVNKPKAAGTACTMGGGAVCDGNGACVQCLVATDCAGMDDACQTRTCTQNTCGHAFTAAGTPLPTQTPGDCHENQCDGNGGVVAANQDTDLPDDMNPCTDDICTAGVPSHNNKAQGAACGTNMVCDGNGACIGCNAASDCPGTDDECKKRTCTAGTCGVAFTASGTALMSQTPNDCRKSVCDGAGSVVNVPDDTDLPLDDGNACTTEACNAGVPSHPAKADGSACNDNNACTQTDTCQVGVCTGGNPVSCAPPDQCHLAGVCDTTAGTCTYPTATDGIACTAGGLPGACMAGTCATCGDGVKNGSETGVDCGGPTCPACAAGQGCTSGTDCMSQVCTGNVCQPCPLAVGLLGGWRGENNAKDSTGAADGMWGGNTNYTAGKLGNAFQFDGASYVLAPVTYSGPMTVDLWVHSTNPTPQNFASPLSSAGSTAAPYFQIDTDGAGNWRFLGEATLAFGPIDTAVFQHLAFTYDGTNLRTYLQGAPAGMVALANAPGFTVLKLGINRIGNVTFAGAVDEVHIWSRALSDTEIQQLFNTPTANLCP
jgi:hypothetical protein